MYEKERTNNRWNQFKRDLAIAWYSSINLDFGLDNTQFAKQSWNNKDYGNWICFEIAAAEEIILDSIIAYGCAYFIELFIEAPLSLQNNTNWLKMDGSPNYPPNNGAIPGTEKVITLDTGKILGRYGEIKPNSDFVTQSGANPTKLSLPPWTNPTTYTQLKVIKDIPNVIESVIAPWADSEGGGLQYQLPQTINSLILNGYLEIVGE